MFDSNIKLSIFQSSCMKSKIYNATSEFLPLEYRLANKNILYVYSENSTTLPDLIYLKKKWISDFQKNLLGFNILVI